MLHPNEHPDPTEENSVKSSDTPETPESEHLKESSAEEATADPSGEEQTQNQAAQTPEPEEQPPVEETNQTDPQDQPSAEAPASEPEEEHAPSELPKEEPPVAEAPRDQLEADPQTAQNLKESPAEPKQEVAENDPGASEEVTESEDQSSEQAIEMPQTPLTEAFLAEVEEKSKDRHSILENASAGELVLLMQGLNLIDDIVTVIPKVGLARRSFDVLRRSQKVDNEAFDAFEDQVQTFNRRRQDHRKQLENSRQEASEKKKQLLEKLQEIIDKDNPQLIKEVRDLQQEWRDAGQALREDSDKLYERYRALLDKFYQQRELFFEMRDYDHRKNLEEKERLIKEAENLLPPEEDRQDVEVWREKIDLLSELQQQWKSVGHVPKDDMDRINESYKAAIDQFFDLRQDFMEVQEKLREENGTQKIALLEKVEPYIEFTAEKPREWNEATRVINEFREEWKKLGPAPHSINSQLWARYREVCNQFFSHKGEFFKKLDEEREENLTKKRALVEQAEAVQESTDWEATARTLKQLQKEWQKIGPVPNKFSNKIWKQFRAACDTFFENRRKHYDSLHGSEASNLEAKKALIEEVKQLSVDKETTADVLVGKVKDLQARWKEIGHVPFKEKDRIWDEFRKEIDKLFNQLSLKRDEISKARMASSIESIDDDDKRVKAIKGRLARTKRRLSEAREKVEQYSTNIQLISKGKSGDALRNQIQAEIDKEKKVVEDLRQKVKLLNQWLKDPSKDLNELTGEGKDQKSRQEAPKKSAEASSEKASSKEHEVSSDEKQPPVEDQPEGAVKKEGVETGETDGETLGEAGKESEEDVVPDPEKD